MSGMRSTFLLFYFLFSLSLYGQETIDPAIIEKIRTEAFNNSSVMNTAFYLTDVSGSRLTGSAGWDRAASWAKNQLTNWGIKNVTFEKWGEFGKGWEVERCYLAMTSPYYQCIPALPLAYTAGTKGESFLKGQVLLLNPKDTNDLKQYEGKIKNKIVLAGDRPLFYPLISFQPSARRFDDKSLEAMKAKDYFTKFFLSVQSDSSRKARLERSVLQNRVNRLIQDEQPSLTLWLGGFGNGNVFADGGEGYKKDSAIKPATLMVAYEDFQKIQRLINAGIPVTIEADVKTKFHTSDINGYNVIAEIQGTDSLLKDEVVMLGAHLDSWHGGTGATDNAAGSAIMLEAMRILTSIGISPRRTIRLVLWNAEEQGLLGSEAYVKAHFADPKSMIRKPEYEKVSVYYNLDNGTGKIRGIYAQGNEAVLPIFNQWLNHFKDFGAGSATIINTGGTDHDSFDAVGIPAFQFIQDPIEYSNKTHHTTSDTYDHLLPEDLKQSAMIVAAFVYQSAQRNELLPRRQMPEPTR